MREKEAERGDIAEGPGQAAGEGGVEGFAVVFEKPQSVAVGEVAHDVKGAGVAQDADAGDGAGAGRQGFFEAAHVHAQGVQDRRRQSAA